MADQHPFLDPSLAVNWAKLTAVHVIPDMEEAMRRGTAAIAAITALSDGGETFANTFLALEEATTLVSMPWSKVNHLTEVNDHAELREAHRTMLPQVSAFFAEIPLNQALYRKLRNFAGTPAAGQLEPIEQRFVRETLKDFEDAGANQPEAVRARLREIESLLADRTNEFSNHVLDSTNAYQRIVDDATELEGLPASLVESARLDALRRGIGTAEAPKYRLTLHAPSIVPAMRFLKSDALRKELFEAQCRIGHQGEYENEPLIREILALRREKARLLGRDIFPDWVLSRRMAKSGREALAFIEDLHAKTKPAFDREIGELMDYKAARTGQPAAPLHPWEFAYWAEQLRRERYAFDEEALRPYFPMPSVMQGLFKLVERLFGIRVEEITTAAPPAWHPEVRTYTLHDAGDGRHLGNFFTDWHPRDAKRSGAWMGGLVTGGPRHGGEFQPHLGYIIGNLTPPVGDKPALLTHREVETVFHEFGHLLHMLLSEVKIRSLAGTNVAWDFVELPSQIMENWCWERTGLDFFARHYETGEPIPADLFDKMQRARTFGSARMQMAQLAHGKMDLALHMSFDPEQDADLDAFIDKAQEGYRAPTTVKAPTIIRFFNHLFSESTGYASGYYSYKWAEVLDADAFTRFTEEGVLNPETGKAFRVSILARGNSDDPLVLFHAFMGRDPDPVALLRRLGL